MTRKRTSPTSKAFAHQRKSLAHSRTTPIVYDASDPGCVSADTEFLTPTGWKRIDAYKEGDTVAQFYPDSREIEFVEPLQYIKKPCREMIHIAPVRGTSQRLSPEHRVLYYRPDGSYGECSAEDFMHSLHRLGPNRLGRKFCTTFSVRSHSCIDLGDTQLRVMVAVIADGHFQNPTNRCTVRLKKGRKIERLRRLLAQAGIDFVERTCGGSPDFQVFRFNAPRRDKEFTCSWWAASQNQLEIIADELPHWDSSIDPRSSLGTRFSSSVSASAEFAQYAFAAAKRPASLVSSFRCRPEFGNSLTLEYNVHARASDAMVGPGRKGSVYIAPNPEGFKYCFRVPTTYLLLRHNGYIFATGNTGKTFVRIQAFAEHREAGGGCALVLAPKNLLRSVWFNDFKKFAPKMRCSVATATDRGEAFEEDADVYITNHDTVKWLAKQPKSFFKRFSDLIIDELTAFKHHTSQRSKALAKIRSHFERRAGMTGTPNGRSITDVWHQIYVLDDGERLGPNFYQFRSQVCDSKQVGRNINAVQWADKDGAEEAVFGLLSDIVIRHKFEDCVDIPALHQYTVPYYLSTKQMTAYAQLEATQMLTLQGPISPQQAVLRMTGKKLAPTGPSITATNAAAVATKLLQVASGAVYEGPDKYHLVDTGRYEMVLDLVEARQHSLCFFFWKHQRDYLIAQAEKRGITFSLIDGSTPDRERERIVAAYQAGAFQVLFAHPKSAAHGLTLTRGTATIWASPTYDLEIFKQGSKRQHRMGQTQKTENIVIVAPGTIEERVYDAMLAKDARMTNLLDLFGSITKDMK